MNPYYKINIGIITKAMFAQVFTAGQINFYKKNYYQSDMPVCHVLPRSGVDAKKEPTVN
jgi:hypothetical protein